MTKNEPIYSLSIAHLGSQTCDASFVENTPYLSANWPSMLEKNILCAQRSVVISKSGYTATERRPYRAEFQGSINFKPYLT
jgi:hypothetical protein